MKVKFKVWSELNKKMYEHDEIVVSIKDMSPELDDILLFTGLHDKNGKEIYFGDILITSNYDDANYDTWESSMYGFTAVQYAPEALGVSFSDWFVEGGDASVFGLKFVKVVGNIFENPDIMK